MRFTRYATLAMLFGTMLLAPVSAPAAASKDMEDLQRDVAQLQDQVTALQKTLDSKLAALQTMVQQSLETANKTSNSVTGLSNGVAQTVQSQLKGVTDQLTNVTGLSVKVDNISNDVSDLHNAVSGLVVTINRMQQQLNDIGNQVKLIQAPPAAPPGADAGSGTPGVAGAPPAPSAQTVFDNAVRDQNGGNSELALSEYKEFLRLYPNDPNAIKAQYNIGNIYYAQGRTTDAVTAYNAAIEQYDVDQVTTPSAYYMRGMALKKEKDLKGARTSFETVVRKFPQASEAGQARTQLNSMGVSAPAKRK